MITEVLDKQKPLLEKMDNDVRKDKIQLYYI
jgi:hypothetical protein